MRILQLHNYYQNAKGGETVVVEAEKALLEARGHCVRQLFAHNDEIGGFLAKLKAGISASYSSGSRLRVESEIGSFDPDVVHAHNLFPLFSPSVYYAARRKGVPVVQTLHNYRLVCPNGQLLRNGRVCELCVGKRVAWPGIVHACYKGSRAATAASVAMASIHNCIGTWGHLVELYVAPSHFVRNKLVQGGLPLEMIEVKPNFVEPDPGLGKGEGGYALFVGRLSAEKGIDTLLSAWKMLEGTVPLKIVGDGPLAHMVQRAQSEIPNLEWLGWLSPAEVKGLMADASFLLVPSKWYETFGLVTIEAFATGTPVLVSNMGSMAELVQDDATGLRFHPGDDHDLAAKVQQMLSHGDELQRMRVRARAEFEAKYTAERNYEMLMQIYCRAIREFRLKAGSAKVGLRDGSCSGA